MQKFEITVSPNYVANWTIVDAIRELLQNAIDAEKQRHLMSVTYDAAAKELSIHSVGARLDISSLLLGSTSKADDAESIGQFGEGYKIATLVLLRNDKPVIFSNGLAKETWRPRFIKSRRFGCNVLGFFVEKWGLKPQASTGELVVTIQNISQQEYDEQIVPSALLLRNDWSVVAHSDLGDVLDIPGAVFVNGLFVRSHQPYKYGYNFKPQYLKLDRDRKLVSDFDLEWLASKMWVATKDTDTILSLIKSNAADTRYLHSNTYNNIELYNAAWQDFIDSYGSNAVPVTTQEELEKLNNKYRPVLVAPAYYELITHSSQYIAPDVDSESIALSTKLCNWFEANVFDISAEAKEEFYDLVRELTDNYE